MQETYCDTENVLHTPIRLGGKEPGVLEETLVKMANETKELMRTDKLVCSALCELCDIPLDLTPHSVVCSCDMRRFATWQFPIPELSNTIFWQDPLLKNTKHLHLIVALRYTCLNEDGVKLPLSRYGSTEYTEYLLLTPKRYNDLKRLIQDVDTSYLRTEVIVPSKEESYYAKRHSARITKGSHWYTEISGITRHTFNETAEQIAASKYDFQQMLQAFGHPRNTYKRFMRWTHRVPFPMHPLFFKFSRTVGSENVEQIPAAVLN